MNRTSLITIAALLSLLIFASFKAFEYRRLYADATKPHPPVPSYAGPASTIAAPIIDTFVDAAGNQHAVIQNPEEIGRRNAAAIVNNVFRPYLDSLADAAGVKRNQVEGYTAVQIAAARDSARFLARAYDSMRKAYRSIYRDKYLTLAVREPAPGDTTAGTFDFAYNADLKFTEYSKQRKVLGIPVGRRKYYTDISSSDPRLKIKGVEKFSMQRRVPALGFRLQALTSYNIETRANTLGLGVRFDAGDRFNCGVNYTYNFLLRDWAPTVYAKYDIIQIGR